MENFMEFQENYPVDKLIPYARNSRTHNDEQVAQIVASIKEFGFTNPILIGADDVIIAGHGRLLAAQRMGLKEVPVVRLPHLTETQRRALVIADNKIALNAGWDEEMLALEMKELGDMDFDLDLLGFSLDELKELEAFGEPEPSGNADEDEVPEVPEEAVTKSGDMWILGEHRLLCGDTTMVDDLKKLMADDTADMIFTDPPYNVNYGSTMKDSLRYHAGTLGGRKIMNDNLGDGFAQFLTDSLSNLMMFNKGAAYVCMSSSELHTLYSAFVSAGGKWSTFIIWAKNTFTLGRADYQRQYEPILYGWRADNKKHYWCGDRDQSDVWEYNKPVRNDLHPTMKPVELVERAINNSSKVGDIVLDGFGGSGSTLIAAEKTRRKARLMELDPKFCDVIVRRWEEYTGKKAELLKDNAESSDIDAELTG
ncbi:MAG: site-specific DNA-methyltransferase [Acetobacter sp.]|nr:site-specific DNA-methyltransferase [Acetobacter sp.]